jgi:hypothetical protein
MFISLILSRRIDPGATVISGSETDTTTRSGAWLVEATPSETQVH